MQTNTQPRALRGIPDGGQYRAPVAPDGDVELRPAIDNTLAGVRGRQLEIRAAFQRDHAGELCPRSGHTVVLDYQRDGKPGNVQFDVPGKQMTGTALCTRCSATAPIVRQWVRGAIGNRFWSWSWTWA